MAMEVARLMLHTNMWYMGMLDAGSVNGFRMERSRSTAFMKYHDCDASTENWKRNENTLQ